MAGKLNSDFCALSCEVEDGIASIRLTRPEAHNCFDSTLHEEFPEALAKLKELSSIKVLIISAEGKSFSAGGDFEMIKAGHHSQEVRDRLIYEGSKIFELLTSLPFPIIAAVQGAAIGLGATVVSLSDIVVAWSEAKIADPHVGIGLVAGDGGIIGWSQSVGVNRAKRYLLTGDTISAKQAFEVGLVTDLVSTPEDVITKAREIAEKINALPLRGVQGTKKAFNQLSKQYTGAVFDLGFQYEMDAMSSDDTLKVVNDIMKKT